MDIKALLDALAGYLDFLTELIQLHGMEKYARLGSISPSLVAYCVVGIFIAYLVAAAKKMPGYERVLNTTGSVDASSQQATKSKADDDTNVSDMARFVLLSIVGASLLHGFLRIYSHLLGSPQIYSIRDTLNAVFAYNALYHPFNAVAKRLQVGLNALRDISRAAAALSALLFFTLAVLYLVGLIYLLYPLAAVHGASTRSMALPCTAFGAFVFVMLGLYFMVLGIPVKTWFSLLSGKKGDVAPS